MILFMLVIFGILMILNLYHIEHYHKHNGIEMSQIMSVKDINDLKKGQLIMKKMLKELDRICRKHNIKYWCGAGTLLGIIRHKGWIPFDGDIDIAMLNDDYNKFKIIIEKELSKQYFFEDKPLNKPCSKIRHLFSHYKYTKGTPNWDKNNGLQIDIFIYNDYHDKNFLKGKYGGSSEWKKTDIFPLKESYFEDIKVYIPNNSKLYLTKQYGKDYIKMPEIKKRYPHEGRIEPNKPSLEMLEQHKKKYNKV